MPLARTLRSRSSRHRARQSSCGCACFSRPQLPTVRVSSSRSWALQDGYGEVDSGVTRPVGTTLGYVKCTWSQLVARCHRSVALDSGEEEADSERRGVCRSKDLLPRGLSSAPIMTKRRPVKPPQNGVVSNGRTGQHAILNGKLASSVTSTVSSWMTPATLLKMAVLVVIAAVGPVIVLKDFRSKVPPSVHFNADSSSSAEQLTPNGGWRLADQAVVAKFGSEYCNIDRVSVSDLNPERFESEYRFKKPVIVTFPNGARDWTDPHKWSLDYLNRSYGEWVMGFGSSLEIVRRGGNGYESTKFSDFIELISQEKNTTSGLPMYYIFDREFYYDSDLPSTFKLPPYFSNNEELQDSIFFLGASGSGVVFHKHSDTWNAVVFGRKRWFLYPMHQTPPGGVYHGYTIMDWYERIYPNLTAQQRPLECIQEGGEILYLPEGFYHATLNIGDTIAVALQNKKPKLTEEKITYEVTDMVKLLGAPNSDDKKINSKLLNKFLKLKELLPESAEVNMKLGEKYGHLGDHETALVYLQKAIEIDPYFVLAYTALGTSLSALNRDEEAERALKYAIELSPKVWDMYKEYSMFLMYKGRYAEAVPYLKKGTELNPDMMPFWSYLKQAQEQTGDLEGAKKTQEKIDQLSHNEDGQNSS